MKQRIGPKYVLSDLQLAPHDNLGASLPLPVASPALWKPINSISTHSSLIIGLFGPFLSANYEQHTALASLKIAIKQKTQFRGLII